MTPLLNLQQAESVGAVMAGLGRNGARAAGIALPDGENHIQVRQTASGAIIVRRISPDSRLLGSQMYRCLADFAAAHAE
ncbi:MAG TPA: hypothetical protein DD803_16120 [Alcaligenes faecalis]|nr:hypothetical protein [Alcaligenes faecalis]HBQ90963.1 hypothetical protein [Alcaligenes faecalis]